MTNQEKLESIIKQAQERGWMGGYRFVGGGSGFGGVSCGFMRENSTIVLPKMLSLNDILFGTDFCEKFIGDFIMGDCSCGISCVYDETIAHLHRIQMATISEPERIDFLYKHVENLPTLNAPLLDNETTVNDLDRNYEMIKENAKLASNPKIIVDEPQPVELKKIEPISVFVNTSPTTSREVTAIEVCKKVNDIISEHNTLVDYVQKLNKECRVNRN